MSTLLEVTEELQMFNEGGIMNNDILVDMKSILSSVNSNLEDLYLFLLDRPYESSVSNVSNNNNFNESNNKLLTRISTDLEDLYLFLLDQSDGTLEERREQQRQNQQLLNALQNNQGGSRLEELKESAKDAKSAGGILGGLGAGIAALGRALASVGAVSKLVVAGGSALGGAIVAIGGGIAGAAWLTGKAFPTFVDGMKSFEEVDGPSLEQAGKGVKELGLGIAAWGAGEIARGIGNIVGSVSSLFGGGDSNQDIIAQLQEFGDADIDTDAVKNNAEAVKAFGVSMAAAGAAQTATGIGSFVSGVLGGLGEFFGGEDSLSQLQEFGRVDINRSNVENNAAAMTAFARAISLGGSGIAVGGIGTFVSGVLGGIGEAIGGEQSDPLSQLKLFGQSKVDAETVRNNAEAMTAFARAISFGGSGVAVGGIGTFVSGVLGGIGEAIGGEQSDPLSQLRIFGQTSVNKQNVVNNAEAMEAFGRAMIAGGSGTAVSGIGTFVSGILGGIGEFFGGDDPLDQLKRFGETEINTVNVKKNASALAEFSKALSGIRDVDSVSALKNLAKNMSVAVPLIDSLSNGGKYNPPGLLNFSVNFGDGILDPSLRLDEVAEKVRQAREVFESSTTNTGIDPLSSSSRSTSSSTRLARAGAERFEIEAEEAARRSAANAPSAPPGGVNVSTNVQNSSNTTFQQRPPASSVPDNASDTMMSAYGMSP